MDVEEGENWDHRAVNIWKDFDGEKEMKFLNFLDVLVTVEVMNNGGLCLCSGMQLIGRFLFYFFCTMCRILYILCKYFCTCTSFSYCIFVQIFLHIRFFCRFCSYLQFFVEFCSCAKFDAV